MFGIGAPLFSRKLPDVLFVEYPKGNVAVFTGRDILGFAESLPDSILTTSTRITVITDYKTYVWPAGTVIGRGVLPRELIAKS